MGEKGKTEVAWAYKQNMPLILLIYNFQNEEKQILQENKIQNELKVIYTEKKSTLSTDTINNIIYWGQPGGVAVKFVCSALAAWGLLVWI